jgi:hypothetical protein
MSYVMIEAMLARGGDISPSPNDDGLMRERRRTRSSVVRMIEGKRRNDVDNSNVVMTTMRMRRRRRISQR